MLVAHSCPTLWDPMDYSRPGSPVRGILQARILEWVAIPFSRGSSWPRNWTQVSHIAGRFFTTHLAWWPSQKVHMGFKKSVQCSGSSLKTCLLTHVPLSTVLGSPEASLPVPHLQICWGLSVLLSLPGWKYHPTISCWLFPLKKSPAGCGAASHGFRSSSHWGPLPPAWNPWNSWFHAGPQFLHQSLLFDYHLRTIAFPMKTTKANLASTLQQIVAQMVKNLPAM